MIARNHNSVVTFCRELKSQLSGNPPSGRWVFDKLSALCANYGTYLYYRFGRCPISSPCLSSGQGWQNSFPFNGGSCECFLQELEAKTLYSNSRRLAYIEEWAAKEIITPHETLD